MRDQIAAFIAACRRSGALLSSDDGVATVEWVALAAAMVIGSVAVAFVVMDGLVDAASNVASQLSP